MEDNKLEDVLNGENTGLDENGEGGEETDVEPKEPIDESGEGNDKEGLPVGEPEEDSLDEATMMNAYESRNRAKSIQVDRDTDEIVEHMEQIREAIERAVEGGMLSVKVGFLAHRMVLEELKRLGYVVGHVSGEVATSIRWD